MTFRSYCLIGAHLLAGCGADAQRIAAEFADASVPGAECGLINQTQACSCDEKPGAQVCTASGWSLCSCLSSTPSVTPSSKSMAELDGGVEALPTPAGNLRTDITFDWERAQPEQGSCEPGHYTGTFVGLYASGLTFVNAPIPVASVAGGLTPGLEFTLEESADGETLTIQDGKMVGTADGLFPFRGTITGALDCKTNKFDAILDGYYSLGVDGVGMFHFKGPIVASYDPNTHTMSNGTWDVTEYDPPPVLPGAGGKGTWTANWKP